MALASVDKSVSHNRSTVLAKNTGQKQADWRTDPARHGRPEIFNTDQGSQFTGAAFTGLLASNGIAISMDGKGAWRDNVFVERLWRSVKYEEVYLRAYDKRRRGPRLDRPISRLLQWPPTAPKP